MDGGRRLHFPKRLAPLFHAVNTSQSVRGQADGLRGVPPGLLWARDVCCLPATTHAFTSNLPASLRRSDSVGCGVDTSSASTYHWNLPRTKPWLPTTLRFMPGSHTRTNIRHVTPDTGRAYAACWLDARLLHTGVRAVPSERWSATTSRLARGIILANSVTRTAHSAYPPVATAPVKRALARQRTRGRFPLPFTARVLTYLSRAYPAKHPLVLRAAPHAVKRALPWRPPPYTRIQH